MRAAALLTCLWPGLARLWSRGDWTALALAIGFAALLNVVLAATFVWHEMWPPAVTAIGWPAVVCMWTVSAWASQRRLREFFPNIHAAQSDGGRGEGLFLQAQAEYLKGDWYQAELLLDELLRVSPADTDAHMMMATLYRHTRRFDDARRQFRTLQRLDAAEKWALEIEQEQLFINRLASPPASPTEEATLTSAPVEMGVRRAEAA